MEPESTPVQLIIWVVTPLEDHLPRAMSLQALVKHLVRDPGNRVVVFLGARPETAARCMSFLPAVADSVLLPSSPGTGWKTASQSIFDWRKRLSAAFRNGKPDLVIAVDKWGLYLTATLGLPFPTRVWYFNLELRVQAETKRLSRRMANSVEAYLHRRCERTLIQDKWRGAWIEKEHRIASSSTLLIPNSPSGAASLRRSRYLREKYKIPAGHVVLLYVGTLAEHFLVRDVVEAAAQSAHVTLIVHSPPSAVRSDYRDEVVSLIEKSSNVHLSVELLDADDLTSLISSADIGVGVFKPVEGNYLNELLMGYSGGKLALYLQSGIPIIASDFPSTQWASECGWCVDPASFSVSILDRILAQYLENRDGYRKEAVAFFNRELSLSRYFEDISRAL